MDLSTMQTEARLIFGEPDTSNTHVDNTQLTAWANEFYRLACVKLRSNPTTATSYTTPTGASPEVTLNSACITVDIAKIYVRPDNRWQALKVIDLDEMLSIDEDWENADVGVPTHLVLMDAFTARLYPPPNTSIESQATSLKTYGLSSPTALSASGDTPNLPIHVHDLFPHYMAYKAFTRLSDKDAAANQLIWVREWLKESKNIAVNRSRGRGWRISGVDGANPSTLSLD